MEAPACSEGGEAVTTYTPDELAAWALDLSDAQQKLLSGFADGRTRMYVHFAVAEALRRRGYLIRSSTLVAGFQWANHEGVRERTPLRPAWRHEWGTTGRGWHLARWLHEQAKAARCLPSPPPAPISQG